MQSHPFRILCTEDDADTRELITFVLTRNNFEVITTETPAVALEIAQAFSFDLYLSKSDYEANQGIKTLTALTAITLPVTIISTWYGMNFEHMPELKWHYGYPACLLVMLAAGVVLHRILRRAGWL